MTEVAPGARPSALCERALFGPVSADSNNAPWASSAWVGLSHLVTGAVPDQATKAAFAWSDDEIRFFFAAEDREPWATLTKRDDPLYTEEVVEVFIDPVGDLLSYYEIEVNPLNAVLDLVIRRTGRGLVKEFAWRCDGLETAVQVAEGHWNSEIAIPFDAIVPERPVPGDVWRLNLCRIDRPRGRERELSAWAPTFQQTFHDAESFGFLRFAG